jgi:hypothetical protein
MRRPPAIVVGVIAVGSAATPFLLGAVAMFALGDLIARRDEADEEESPRGRVALIFAGAIGGALSWLPAGPRVIAVSALTLALALLAYAPAFLTVPSTSWRRAIASSIDLTLRARPRDLVAAIGLSGFLAATPSCIASVWHLRLGGSISAALGRTMMFGTACVIVAVIGATCGCFAMMALSERAADRQSLRRPLSIAGGALGAVSGAALLWLAVAPALCVRIGLALPVASMPVGVEWAPQGPMVVWHRHDGREFGVLGHGESGAWWIDTVDLATARNGAARSTPLADPRVMETQLRITALVGLFAILLAWLAGARVERLRRMFRRSQVVRVRVKRGDLVVKPTARVGTVRVGAELLVVDDQNNVRLQTSLPITGIEHDDGDPDAWIDASLVTRGGWSTAAGYRTQLAAPPADARIIGGTPDDALVGARLDDLERALLALWLAPAFAIGIALFA